MAIRVKWVLTCLVFYGLPFLLLAYGLGVRWEVREQESRETVFKGLDSVLLAIRKRENTEQYLSDLLNKLFYVAFRSPRRFVILGRGLRRMHERFPGVFRFVVTDGSGDIIPRVSDEVPSRRVIRMLFEVLAVNDHKTLETRLQKAWGIFKTFIGNDSTPDQLNPVNRDLFQVSFNAKNRRFGYRTSDRLGLFVHASHNPDWGNLAIIDLCRQFMKFRGNLGIEAGFVDVATASKGPPDLEVALAAFQKANDRHILTPDSLYSIVPLSGTTRLWVRRSRDVLTRFDSKRLLLASLGGGIFGVLSFLSLSVMVLGKSFRFSIQWRLVVLFAFASGLPLAVVILAGWDYLNQKYQSRVRQAHDDAERFLMAFDGKFPQMRGLMEIRLRKLFAKCHFDTPRGKAFTRKVMEYFKTGFRGNDLLIYDRKGKIAAEISREFNERTDRNRKMMGGLAGTVLGNLRGEDFKGGMDSATLLLESLAGSNSPLVQMTRNLGRIIDFSIAGNLSWTYIYPINDRVGRPEYMAIGYWRKQDLERVYLGGNVLSAHRAIPGLSVYAPHVEYQEGIPGEFPLAPRLGKFIEELKVRQSTTIAQMRFRGKNYLVTGIKPKEMFYHLLISVQPDDEIRREIGVLENRLWAFSSLCAGISVFLGLILSQRFLTPIGELAGGVVEIQKRNFKHRVPIHDVDELGELAGTFNRVMEGLTDLEVGRIVQESLFPTEEVKAGNVRIFGRSVSASELGGDYFDLQKLPDGRILVLIGDVSGHGVPAALVMAMAKALVERECEGNPSPDKLLDIIHRVFYRTLKRKRMMTCFLGLYNTETDEFHFSNAGHNFPFFFRHDGEVLSLENKSLPLGSMKRNSFTTDVVRLEPGDRILLYTDGLVEARTHTGFVGYQTIRDVVGELLEDDPRKSCDQVFQWHRNLTTGGPQEDDITVVLLNRQTI